MTGRDWSATDLVAEYRDGQWRKGTVAAADKWSVTIRWDGAGHLVYRSPRDACLTDPEQVPIDERHWLPEQLRDQLVRQEAAGRLRAMAECMPYPTGLLALAELVDAGDPSDADYAPTPVWAAAVARALLTPAPVTTPTTEGLPA